MDDLKKKTVCLTLDLECDFGELLPVKKYEGLKRIDALVKLLAKRGIPLTCFIQGSLLETHADTIKKFSGLDIEFQLHSYSHATPEQASVDSEVRNGVEAYEKYFGRRPTGYRAPLGIVNGRTFSLLSLYGFEYDSSIFPSFRPNRFSNLDKPTTPFFINAHILEIPFTVFSGIIRIPIALSYIKLLGRPYKFCLRYGRLPKLIVFDFHLHDLFRIDSSRDIDFDSLTLTDRLVLKKLYLNERIDGLATFEEIISIFQDRGYTFAKMNDVYQEIVRYRESQCVLS